MLKYFFSDKKVKLENVKIRHDKDIQPDKIQSLYLSVGWKYRENKDIKTAIDNSILITSAWHEEQLIGLARATGDGVFNVTIWDVAVRPAYQNQGVGKLLIKSMLDKLNENKIPLVTLYAEWAKKDFYSKLGFESNSNRIVGMYKYIN